MDDFVGGAQASEQKTSGASVPSRNTPEIPPGVFQESTHAVRKLKGMDLLCCGCRCSLGTCPSIASGVPEEGGSNYLSLLPKLLAAFFF